MTIEAKFSRLVRSLYAQKFPRFELIVSSAAAELLPDEHRGSRTSCSLRRTTRRRCTTPGSLPADASYMIFTGPEFAYQSGGIRALFAAADEQDHDIVTSAVYSTETDSPDRLGPDAVAGVRDQRQRLSAIRTGSASGSRAGQQAREPGFPRGARL